MIALSLVLVASCKKTDKPIDPKAIEGYWKLTKISMLGETSSLKDNDVFYYHFKNDGTFENKQSYLINDKNVIVAIPGTWKYSNGNLQITPQVSEEIQKLSYINIDGSPKIIKVDDKELLLSAIQDGKEMMSLTMVKITKEVYDKEVVVSNLKSALIEGYWEITEIIGNQTKDDATLYFNFKSDGTCETKEYGPDESGKQICNIRNANWKINTDGTFELGLSADDELAQKFNIKSLDTRDFIIEAVADVSQTIKMVRISQEDYNKIK